MIILKFSITAAGLDLQSARLVKKSWRHLKRRDGFKIMKRMGKSPGFIKLLKEKLLKNYQKNYCNDFMI